MNRLMRVGIGLLGCAASVFAQNATPKRNVILFIADGLRPGSVTATVAPTMYGIRQNGVNFANSHSMFPTFTTPNASALATGHYLGDTGDFSNTIYSGFPAFNTGLFGKTAGTVTPFLENNQILSDMDAHYQGNYLTEESVMAIARRNGYNTAAVGKVGPVGIQDVTQTNSTNSQFVTPTTVIIDDATGTAAGVPLPTEVASNLKAAGLSTTPTARSQPSGNNTTPGTLSANVGQQQYFVDALTKAVLPAFQKNGKPFYVVYWSRDPDGSQHNQGDSLNKLTPGINGPTSVAAVTNADNNLKQILDFVNSDPTLAGNTDIIVTADHGFATISKHEVDNAGTFTKSYAATFTYKDANGNQEVNTGFLPAGFLAIDVAHALNLPIYDPDSLITDPTTKVQSYTPVDPTIPQQTATKRQRSASGNALIGGTGQILNQTDAKVIVAANGGSDLIYVPSKDATLVQQIVTFLASQDYVGGLFVDDAVGPISGALPLSSIGLKGITNVPTPTIVVNFKTFAVDPTNPLMTAVQIADSTLQEGQGMHGTLSRDNTFNNMAAIGPDFKTKYVDKAPVSNADLAVTIANLMGLPISNQGKLLGRVATEALTGNADTTGAKLLSIQSAAATSGKRTVLVYQQLGSNLYFDQATLSSTLTQAVAGPKQTTATSRELQLDASSSTSTDGGALTYSWSLAPGSPSAAILRSNTANPVVQFSGGRGIYTFVLSVTDASGVTSTDTVSIPYVGR